jgi:hypothetical protein
MASSLYDSGRQAFLTANHTWGTTAARCHLHDNGTVDASQISTYDNLDDIVSGQLTNGESSNLTYTTATPGNIGIADADDVSLTSVSGNTAEAIVIFKETGVDSTSTLLVYIDTVTPAFPFTPNGGDVTITWAGAANYIFKL